MTVTLDALRMDKFKPKNANKYYESLQLFSATRAKEISEMSEPFIKITDRYGRLISRVTLVLGRIKPINIQDIVLRDLLVDIFDCLYESRFLIMAGKLNVAYPIARRAYESLSLMSLCAIDNTWAEKWQKGKKIGNAEIRKEKFYNFFCLATHPNRDLIPRRFLGEGNQYVLGVIEKPNLLMVIEYCTKILEMWFWLAAMVTFFYRATINKIDKGYFDSYMQTAKEAQNVKNWLNENFNKLLEEEQEYWRQNPVEE
jgi:sorbitol-specific phosphotransferase system component IIC